MQNETELEAVSSPSLVYHPTSTPISEPLRYAWDLPYSCIVRGANLSPEDLALRPLKVLRSIQAERQLRWAVGT